MSADEELGRMAVVDRLRIWKSEIRSELRGRVIHLPLEVWAHLFALMGFLQVCFGLLVLLQRVLLEFARGRR